MSLIEMSMASLFPPTMLANPNDNDHLNLKAPVGFLNLPAEIRNIIYRLLLTSPLLPMLRRLTARNHISNYVLPPLPLCPNLIGTCRQIHAEARSFFYAENTFVAHSSLLTGLPYLYHPQRPIITPGICSMISKWYINVRLECDARYSEEDLKEAFDGCEELEVEATQSMYRSADYANLLRFKGVRGVKRAKVEGSVEPEFAEWLERCMTSPIGTQCEDMGKTLKNIGGYSVWVEGNR